MTYNTINNHGDFIPTKPYLTDASLRNINGSIDAYYYDSALASNVKKLPAGKKIQDYGPRQTETIQMALYKWLVQMPFYKGKTFTELFKRPGTCDGFTFNALKVFSRCYDLKFEGKLEAEHIAALENIARGTFADAYSPYRLKSPIAEKLYASACARGIDGALEIKYDAKSQKSFSKTYTIGEKSNSVKILKTYLNTWMSGTSPKNDFKLNETSDVFDEQTYKALEAFNLRFGIPVRADKITADHLNILKDLHNGAFTAQNWQLKTQPQKQAYKLIQKHGVLGALAVYKKEQARKLMASRYGMFKYRNWGVGPEISAVISKLEIFLAQQTPSYSIRISSGRRSWGLSPAHPGGRAMDFTVYIGGRQITADEAKKNVAPLIERFRAENNLKFSYLNEYGRSNWFSSTTGDNFHIEVPKNNVK